MVDVLLTELADVSQAVAATSARLAKVAALADALRAASVAEIPVVVAYLSGELPQRQAVQLPGRSRVLLCRPAWTEGFIHRKRVRSHSTGCDRVRAGGPGRRFSAKPGAVHRAQQP